MEILLAYPEPDCKENRDTNKNGRMAAKKAEYMGK